MFQWGRNRESMDSHPHHPLSFAWSWSSWFTRSQHVHSLWLRQCLLLQHPPLPHPRRGGFGSVSQGLAFSQWQHFRACFSRMMSRGKHPQLHHWRLSSRSPKANREENDKRESKSPASGTREGFISVILTYFSFSFSLYFRRQEDSSPPPAPFALLWIGIFYCALLSCAAHCSLSHRSAKLVLREPFSMKLKISISLCLLLETWSLPWQKGQ